MMLLLTFESWLGPKINLSPNIREDIPVVRRFVTIVSKTFSVAQVLERLHEAEISFNQDSEYMATEYNLLSVSHMESVPDHVLQNARVAIFDNIKDDIVQLRNI